MKRKILFASTFLVASSLMIVSSCKKTEDSDNTSPVVTLNGSASEEVSLGGSYTDPGATAHDDVDGAVTVTSDYSSTNPNINRVNSYTITYTAYDAAGNTGSATRTVRVKNDAEGYVGTYTVTDTCGGLPLAPFTQSIYVDSITNNRIHFTKFANYANNTGIYGTRFAADDHFEIPFQAANSIGTGAGACDVVDHTFVSQAPGSITIVNGSVFKISYTDAVITGGCTGSTSCISYFVKQ